MSDTDELVCLFNGNGEKGPCFTPIQVESGQTEAVCPNCGTRHVRDESGRWERVKEEPTT